MLWYLLLFFSKHLVKTALEIELKSQDTFKLKRAVALIILNFVNCKQFNRLTQALLDYKVEFNFRNFSLTFCLHWTKSGRGSTLLSFDSWKLLHWLLKDDQYTTMKCSKEVVSPSFRTDWNVVVYAKASLLKF